jgi:hypothetical protein
MTETRKLAAILVSEVAGYSRLAPGPWSARFTGAKEVTSWSAGASRL